MGYAEIQFTPDLEIGIPLIDSQHREYIRRLNLFNDKCYEGIDEAEIEEHFRFVESYALEHLDSEEFFMRENGVPVYDEQVKMHDYFKRQLEAIKVQIEVNGYNPENLESLHGLLVDWFLNHIRKCDKQVAGAV